MVFILKAISHAKVPRENFQIQSPVYKPVEGQGHSAELRWLSSDLSELTSRIWHKPLVLLMRSRAIIAKASCTSKCYQILESSEEQRPDKHDFRDRILWLKFNMFTTNNFIPLPVLIFSSTNKALTSFNIWVEDGPQA